MVNQEPVFRELKRVDVSLKRGGVSELFDRARQNAATIARARSIASGVRPELLSPLTPQRKEEIRKIFIEDRERQLAEERRTAEYFQLFNTIAAEMERPPATKTLADEVNPSQPIPTELGDTKTNSRHRGPTINQRMSDKVMKEPEAIGWNSPKWAKYLRCTRSAVTDTATWKALERFREQAKAERMNDRRRKPKASDLNRAI